MEELQVGDRVIRLIGDLRIGKLERIDPNDDTFIYLVRWDGFALASWYQRDEIAKQSIQA